MRIKLHNIFKRYKEVEAVRNLSVDIEEGSLVCLLGPSGCGKSTTLSMIAGLELPTEGQIYFDEEDVSFIDAEQRNIGMVFQNYALYPHMTVKDNIGFPLKLMKIKKSERERRVVEVAKLMQIEDLLKRKPGKLSGGQQQRVAIARAIVKRPQLLLLDEPLSNLDARLRIELREEIRNLQRKLKITTIFVTHDQEEALSISDKILLLKDGELQQYSAPKDMYMNPENRFVAGFLGNPPMNFLQGSYKAGKLYMKGEKGETEIFSEVVRPSREYEKQQEFHKACILGIRPEDIILRADKKGVPGRITSVQTLGKEVYINFQVDKVNLCLCTSWDSNYSLGDEIYFTLKLAHLFKVD